MKNSKLFFYTLYLLLGFSTLSHAETKVIGYIPSFKGLIQSIDNAELDKVTHLNISFLNPGETGELLSGDTFSCFSNGAGNTTKEELHYAVNAAHEAGVKVLVSVAGGVIPSCSGNWEQLLTGNKREKLVNELLAFVDEFNLDGLDIDIEGVLLTSVDNANNYTPFIQELSVELKQREKLLTCATASYVGGMIPTSSVPYFDFINIMSYDAIGPSWGTPGVEHATYEQALNHIDIWQKRGATKEQLVLGVPFYGYGFGKYKANYSYADIVNDFGIEATEKDLIGSACAGCDYVTYNGLPTIIKKTKLALEYGSGVMIWELTHDTHNEYSLLTAITHEIQAYSGISGVDSALFFDDFNYDSLEALEVNNWEIRNDVEESEFSSTNWDKANVSISDMPTINDNKVLTLSASTNIDGNSIDNNRFSEGERSQSEVFRNDIILSEGTMAARFFYSNSPEEGSEGDTIVQSFSFLPTNLKDDLDKSISLEYLANGGRETGSTNSMFMVNNSLSSQENSKTNIDIELQGWHTLIMQHDDNTLFFYMDERLIASFEYDEEKLTSTLSIKHYFDENCFDINCQSSGFINETDNRRYQFHVDWLYFQKDNLLSYSDIMEQVSLLRNEEYSFVNSLPDLSDDLNEEVEVVDNDNSTDDSQSENVSEVVSTSASESTGNGGSFPTIMLMFLVLISTFKGCLHKEK